MVHPPVLAWWLLLVPMSAISGLLYYLGGESGWNTKVRDWGCNTIAIAMLLAEGLSGWTLALSWLLLFGALTTYWKGDLPDCKWYHWLAHGVCCGVALLPVAIQYGLVPGWCLYTTLLGVSMCLWSETFNDVEVESGGRGVFIILLLPLLFVK